MSWGDLQGVEDRPTSPEMAWFHSSSYTCFNFLYAYSCPSVSVGSASVDSTNRGLKIFFKNVTFGPAEWLRWLRARLRV